MSNRVKRRFDVSNEVIVDVKLDSSIEALTTLEKQESVTHDGNTVSLLIGAALPTEHGPYEVEIRPDMQRWSQNVHLDNDVRNIRFTEVHIDNEEEPQRGVVNMDDPFGVFKSDVQKTFFAAVPGKTVAGASIAAIVNVLNVDVFDLILPFSIIAVLDLIGGLIPGAHPVGVKRSSTLISKAWQYAISGLLLLASGVGRYIAKTVPMNGMSRFGIEAIPTVFIGFVFVGYFTRMFGSFIAVFYGDKKRQVQKKYLALLPKPLRDFFGDPDITG